ncbi:hypothetical protein [Delftia acidovorans]
MVAFLLICSPAILLVLALGWWLIGLWADIRARRRQVEEFRRKWGFK